MTVHKFKIGDMVVYEGIVGIIESLDIYAISGDACYGLVSATDAELTCTAAESKCSLYNGEEIDELPALNAAYACGMAIQGTVGKLTDKYFRDGNH